MAIMTTGQIPTALAAAVNVDQVKGLLGDRADEDIDASAVLRAAAGVAAEIAPLAGLDTETQRWALAVWACTLGAAYSIESGNYPIETGLDETGLSRSLRLRYAGVLVQLGGTFADDAAGQREPNEPPSPCGSFPPAQAYPDPAFGGYRRW